jgi:hypothetical protein
VQLFHVSQAAWLLDAELVTDIVIELTTGLKEVVE